MTLLLYIFIGLTGIRLAYWAFFFTRIGRFKVDINYNQQEKVSIIVCAKNEYQNLSQLIPILLNQQYKDYQIIIVDDYSTDETYLLKSQYKSIDWVTPPQNAAGKKIALSAGIGVAKNDILLMTDADCQPSVNWVASMVSHLNTNQMVLGYSPMMRAGSCLSLNAFARYETIMTALQYLGNALARMPYMGIGRNILYRKSLYQTIGGFASHQDIISGDDDLFVQDVLYQSKDVSIGIALESESHVPTWSPQSWKAYINQKRRHASTSIKYAIKHQILLFIWAITHMAWVVTFLVCTFTKGGIYIAITAILFWILATILHYKSIIRLDGRDLLKWFPILDIGLGINYIIVGILLTKDKILKRQAWT